MNKINKIGIIGLGYVGLPLAIEFGKKYQTIGYDINNERIKQLKKSIDYTGEIKKKEFIQSSKLSFTNNYEDLKKLNIFIIATPTPISKNNQPNLKKLKKACGYVGKLLKKNDLVIIESTLYPGATEEVCVPIFEKFSKLKFNKDFFCGYSPERINPGESKYKLKNICKITSGSNKKIAQKVDNLYSKIISAGTIKVSSIKIAEAAKVIENCQRDLNVAFVNELSILFDKIKIDTHEVLEAASTKWNFINFKPGLVGGHCIGVDPYYLTYQAKKSGYKPKLILAGRQVNSNMGIYSAKKLLHKMRNKKINILNSKILIMGFSFKENCKDVRNTRIIDIYNYLKNKKCKVDVYDPIANENDIFSTYKLKLTKKLKYNNYNSIIIAVSHNIFKKIGINKIKKLGKKNSIIFDIKSLFAKKDTDITL
tara:strand:- start:1644 stop:2915 length:1272 start_codon:yes stop_codon:yes gene_type:complete